MKNNVSGIYKFSVESPVILPCDIQFKTLASNLLKYIYLKFIVKLNINFFLN